MTKVAARKTAGVLGDDLALNAQQVSGIRADRELPVVWAVAKGSFRNKLILVPAALAISALAAWAITPLLMLGGAYLCYEGFEKLAHWLVGSPAAEQRHHEDLTRALVEPGIDMLALENDRIRGAIRTDFILSAEIIVITLGTVAGVAFGTQVAVLAAIALLMTVGVYGLVAGIVKLDDLGLHLSRRPGDDLAARLQRRAGRRVVAAAPSLMKALSVVGTIAMFLVGGGILTHGLPGAYDLIQAIAHRANALPAVGGMLGVLIPLVLDALVGVLAGALVLGARTVAERFWRALQPA